MFKACSHFARRVHERVDPSDLVLLVQVVDGGQAHSGRRCRPKAAYRQIRLGRGRDWPLHARMAGRLCMRLDSELLGLLGREGNKKKRNLQHSHVAVGGRLSPGGQPGQRKDLDCRFLDLVYHGYSGDYKRFQAFDSLSYSSYCRSVGRTVQLNPMLVIVVATVVCTIEARPPHRL